MLSQIGPVMNKCSFLILLFSFLLQLAQGGLAAENYAVPLTEWGLPDMQGVWNFCQFFGSWKFLKVSPSLRRGPL